MTGVVAVYDLPNNFVQFSVGTATVNVDWGDGTTSTGVTGTISKNYVYANVTNSVTTEGFKTARVVVTLSSGTLTALNFNVANSLDVVAVASQSSMVQFLEIKIASSTITSFQPLADTTGVQNGKRTTMLRNVEIGTNAITSFAWMFSNASSLQRASIQMTTAATSTSSMFNQCSVLKEVIFTGDASNVTTMVSMFIQAVSLRGVILPNFSNTSLNMTTAFQYCTTLEVVGMPSARPLNLTQAFQYCYSLRQFPKIDLSGATNLTRAFDSCQSLQYVPSLNLSSATNASYMFNGSQNLEQVGRITTSSSLTTTTGMFQNCISLRNGPTVTNMTSVTNAALMFLGCVSMRTAASMTSNGASADFSSCFQSCQSLIVGPAMTITNASSVGSMFQHCYSMRSCGALNFGTAATCSSVFNNCYSLEVAPTITNSASPTTMASMFSANWSLRDASAIGSMITSSVASTTSMFNSCYSLTTLPSGTFFSAMPNLSPNGMFTLCVSLQSTPTLGIRGAATTTFLTAGALQSIGNTVLTNNTTLQGRFDAAALNTIYNNLPSALGRTITTASGSGSVVTFTTSVAHGYAPGQSVTTAGIVPSGYNLTGTITSCPTSTTFTVANAATGAYTSGGTTTINNKTLTVSGNPGYATSTTATATGKGWTVA